ncbi:MAG: alpha/beta hydrolase family protein [Rickettsiales bacterium]|jgi:predicted alpha/beta hydrolase family esterase|nr:alpha/beta hydrolase family protein [Rickettsiales bacterium]
MKNAVICHGVNKDFDYASKKLVPSSSSNWLPWLQQRYLLSEIDCQNPAFLHSWVPDRKYEDDVEILKRYEIGPDTALIAHSCGAGFLVRYLSENPGIKIKHLVLVAPWMDGHNILGDYFDFTIDINLPERIEKMDFFYSTDDESPYIQETFDKILKIFPNINAHKFSDKGHFTESDMKTIEFPELWEVCKSEI